MNRVMTAICATWNKEMPKRRGRGLALLGLVATLALGGCTSGLDQQSKEFANESWAVTDTVRFQTKVPTQQVKAMYLKARTGSEYPYSNLYIKVVIKDKGGKALLSELHELPISDPSTGKPLGSGLGDAHDVEALAYQNLKLPVSDSYEIALIQYMRQPQLPGIMSVGFRLE